MSASPSIDAFIICWTGKEQLAQHIAAAIASQVDRLFVIYSNASNTVVQGAGEWIQVPDEYFYGKKFEACLQRTDADVMLQIQADAGHDDWPAVIAACRRAFAEWPDLAVWAPSVDHTPYHIARSGIVEAAPGLYHVAQTDGVVWAMTRATCDRLREFDYDINNLGWGMDWVAICHAYANGNTVLVDTSILVVHPRGHGYKGHIAREQMYRFFERMTLRERLYFRLLYDFMEPKKGPGPTFGQNLRDLFPSLRRQFRAWRNARRARRRARR